MIAAWRVIAAAQRSKEVRTQGESRYKKKVHFLGDSEEGTRRYTENRRENRGGAYSLEKEKVRIRRKSTAGGALTNWRWKREGKIGSQEESLGA